MKRRTLDIIFAAGGIAVALILAILGVFVFTQYQFSTNYVKQELSAQKITFTPAANLSAEEKNWKAGSVCLTEFAGQTMQTGAQAECYASYYIALHMETAAVNAGLPGATYATLGATQTDLRNQIAAAKAKGDQATVDATQKKLDAAASLRTTMQTGETLRGLLLTTYGFSVIGQIAGDAAYALFALAIVMVVLSLAGFVHAYVTPKDKVVFAPVRDFGPAAVTA
jgi:hypothetical protein